MWAPNNKFFKIFNIINVGITLSCVDTFTTCKSGPSPFPYQELKINFSNSLDSFSPLNKDTNFTHISEGSQSYGKRLIFMPAINTIIISNIGIILIKVFWKYLTNHLVIISRRTRWSVGCGINAYLLCDSISGLVSGIIKLFVYHI